jgi:predicted enzyme related to lactoylglutathione lyase
VATVEITKAYFMVPVQKMERAVAFYRDVLGLTVRFTSPDWTELHWQDATIALHLGGDQDRRESWLGFEVADLDGALAAIVAGGGTVGDERTEGGVRLVTTIDTEGNSLTMGQRPAR